MPRRIEIELTSARDDGSWTWRAAGAKEPRGTVAGEVVGPTAKVGDVLRVEADFFVDGIQITSVVPTKEARPEAERLELIRTAPADDALVTSNVSPRRDDRRPRGDRPRRDGDRREGRDGDRRDRRERGERGDRGDRRDRREGERRARPPRPEPPPLPVVERPKAKRLRPGKAHRNALLESLAEEQRPIAEQVILGGLPAVRQAIEKQNAERAAAGEPAIAAGPLLELAEKLVPKVRAAEWRDRAEAAQQDLEVIDLRDLRSVVSAADGGAKDEEVRALAQALKEGLAKRVDAEHASWLEELTATVEVGRIVRALRLSSRPPKAGAPLPADLATKLTEGAGAALTEDAAAERWVAVLEALAFSPVRDKVIPASLPKELHADVRSTIARLGTRIPKIAHIFEITPDPAAPRPKVERRRPSKPKPAKQAAPKPETTDEPKPEAATDEPEAAADATPTAEPEPEEPKPEAGATPTEEPKPEVDAAPTEEPRAEATEAPEVEVDPAPAEAPEVEAAEEAPIDG